MFLLPTKEEVTREVLNGMYTFVGKVIKDFYKTNNVYVGLYLYVLIIELAMACKACSLQKAANWALVATDFEDRRNGTKLYSLRNKLAHDPYDFNDWKILLRKYEEIDPEHIEVVERLAFNCNPGIIRDIMKCVEQESLKNE